MLSFPTIAEIRQTIPIFGKKIATTTALKRTQCTKRCKGTGRGTWYETNQTKKRYKKDPTDPTDPTNETSEANETDQRNETKALQEERGDEEETKSQSATVKINYGENVTTRSQHFWNELDVTIDVVA